MSEKVLTRTERTCAEPERFVRGGPTLRKFFSFFFSLMRGGRKDQYTTISGLSLVRSAKHYHWRFAGVPMMAQH